MPEEIRLLLAALVFVLVGLGMLVRGRREGKSVGILATTSPPPEDPTVAARFQRRRRGCLWTCGLVGPPALLLLFADTERFLVPSFVALVVLFVALPLFAMRCPACGEVPEADRRAIDLNPAKCPGCGARLR